MDTHFLLRLFRSAGVRRRVFFLFGFLSLIAALLEGLCLGLMIPLINAALKGDPGGLTGKGVLGGTLSFLPRELTGSGLPVFYALIVLIAAAWIFKNVLNYAASVGVSRQVRQLENRLRQRIYERYLGFGKLFFDRNSSGQFYQVMIGYTASVAQALTGAHLLFYHLSVFLIYLGIMTLISWKLTLAVMLVAVVMYRSVGKLILKIRSASDSYSRSSEALARDLSNTLTCVPLVKAYANERREKMRFARSSDEIAKYSMIMDRKRFLIEPVQETIMVLMVLVLGGFVGYFALKGHAGIGKFAMFFVFTRRLALVSGGMSKVWASITSVSGPVRAIREILDDRDKFFVPEGAFRFEGLKQRVQFDRLTFSYAEDAPAVRDVSFTAEKGRLTAIVGPSGAGKTTLAHLLMRFYDAPPGAIRIDGRDIREFTHESLRAGIALVSQEPFLFCGSIRANLTYGLERQVAEAEILGALEKAALGDFVKGLPQGLETEVGERGARFSEGEAQRLSIARAILKGAEILIFDEATSALDTANEKLIQSAIARAAQGRTAIVIAHRLSTIKHADKVVVIENGAVAEEGGVEELLAKNGRFRHYWEMQH